MSAGEAKLRKLPTMTSVAWARSTRFRSGKRFKVDVPLVDFVNNQGHRGRRSAKVDSAYAPGIFCFRNGSCFRPLRDFHCNCFSFGFDIHGIFHLPGLHSLEVQPYPRTKEGQFFPW